LQTFGSARLFTKRFARTKHFVCVRFILASSNVNSGLKLKTCINGRIRQYADDIVLAHHMFLQ
jgi:hypothetical protein